MTAPTRDIVQYYIVNTELGMSPGKIAAQVAHAATTMTLHCLLNDKSSHAVFQAWLNAGQKKIVLQGTEADLLRLSGEGYLSIRDAGHTEIPSGSLTVVVLPPADKEELRQVVGSFKLL
ncbi:peptidyl-tRNA hydrolase [Paenibacillus sp. UNCCL117]|uniref:aminoacyl-tRNA hydrolase n=1 Tax=unclassified Paenibacillus TaxID=185978 RepID=UPI00088FB820|nr:MULTISPECIES: aminoacyl-tRNA hydrolase [unclassified Paenibacillus]SDC65357.1 peptidyl-tRNA hydrolase [Paenibacillus sp. cl123]SFW22753.1 peptidyl-tRNA hydrolase [Paenibacillus sp. UNCCL117]